MSEFIPDSLFYGFLLPIITIFFLLYTLGNIRAVLSARRNGDGQVRRPNNYFWTVAQEARARVNDRLPDTRRTTFMGRI